VAIDEPFCFVLWSQVSETDVVIVVTVATMCEQLSQVIELNALNLLENKTLNYNQ